MSCCGSRGSLTQVTTRTPKPSGFSSADSPGQSLGKLGLPGVVPTLPDLDRL